MRLAIKHSIHGDSLIMYREDAIPTSSDVIILKDTEESQIELLYDYDTLCVLIRKARFLHEGKSELEGLVIEDLDIGLLVVTRPLDDDYTHGFQLTKMSVDEIQKTFVFKLMIRLLQTAQFGNCYDR